MEVGNINEYDMIVGKTQGEPEASEMAQKPVVHPIERIPAYSGVDMVVVRPMQREGDHPLEPRIRQLHPTPFSRVPIPF